MATQRTIAAYTHPSAETGAQQPDTRPGNYYVTCSEGDPAVDGFYYCLGPFRDDHAKALSYVEPVRAAYLRHDGTGRAHWMRFGTVLAPDGYDKPAVGNKLFPDLFGQPSTTGVKEA